MKNKNACPCYVIFEGNIGKYFSALPIRMSKWNGAQFAIHV